MSSDHCADERIEIIPSKKVNSEWLVLNDLYIQHKNRSFVNGNVIWECKHRRGMGCPFRMETADITKKFKYCGCSSWKFTSVTRIGKISKEDLGPNGNRSRT